MLMFFLLLLGYNDLTHANSNMSVVEVRRNITLSEEDPVYKDFYINAGPASGLKKGLVVTAVRKVNIRDASGASAVGDIMIPVGHLKVIAVFDKVAVAREFNLFSRDELPMLEQIGIMTGDQIDLKGSFIDKSKPKKQIAMEQENSTSLTATIAMSSGTTQSSNPPPDAATPVETAKAVQPKTPKIEEPTNSAEPKSTKPGA